MKMLIIFATLFAAQNSFALSLEDLHGCFETLKINGEKPAHGPYQNDNQSELEKMERSETYRDIKTNKFIPLSILTLFTGYDEGYSTYNPLVIFRGQGVLREMDDELFYEVDKDVIMKDRFYRTVKADHYLKLVLKKNEDQTIDGEATFTSYVRGFDRHITFTLKQELCAPKKHETRRLFLY